MQPITLTSNSHKLFNFLHEKSKYSTLKNLIFASYWGSSLVQFLKFKSFLWVCSFLGKNLSTRIAMWGWRGHGAKIFLRFEKCFWYLIQKYFQFDFAKFQGNPYPKSLSSATVTELLWVNKAKRWCAENETTSKITLKNLECI